MADRTPYPVRIVTPEGIAFEGNVQILLVTSVSGAVGMLARHAPLVADLKLGHVRVQLENDTWRTWATAEGFVKVANSNGLVLVEDAVDVDEIDPAAIDRSIAEAEAQIAAAEKQAATDEVYTLDLEAPRRTIAWAQNQRAVHEQFADEAVAH